MIAVVVGILLMVAGMAEILAGYATGSFIDTISEKQFGAFVIIIGAVLIIGGGRLAHAGYERLLRRDGLKREELSRKEMRWSVH